MEKIRTFIAIDVSPSTSKRACSLIERLRASGAKVNWTAPENMHLTLKFLGEVPNVETVNVCRAVSEAAAKCEPFEFVCNGGADAFPDIYRPRTVWLGVEQGTEELIVLHAEIENNLAQIGYSKERRRFHPHLTLGRVRSGGPTQKDLSEMLQANASFDAGSSEVTEVLIFASFLDKRGPTYEILGRAKLGG